MPIVLIILGIVAVLIIGFVALMITLSSIGHRMGEAMRKYDETDVEEYRKNLRSP